MRRAAVFLLCLFAGTVLGQTPSTGSLFQTTRFQATVVVRKHSTGADLVEVTVLEPAYSRELLRDQITLMGKELNSAPRGLQIYDYRLDPGDASSRMVKASFAVDGLIDRKAGVLHIQPIARAFALQSAHDSIDALMIQFEGETPTANTLRACSPPAPGCENVVVEGRASDAKFGVEYRVKLLAHDPYKIFTPDTRGQTSAPKAVLPTKKGLDWTFVALIIVSALALGALVYSLLSRGRPRPPAARA